MTALINQVETLAEHSHKGRIKALVKVLGGATGTRPELPKAGPRLPH